MSATREVQSVLVKRYGGSRLYDTADGRYVSVEQLRQWAVQGAAFRVIDADTEADITHVLLA